MEEKEYAVVALKEILIKAMDAVGARAAILDCPHTGTSLDEGAMTIWDLEFAQMTREKQAAWLIQLFEALVEYG